MAGLFDQIAEERIREALAAGVFDDLPGQGRPLALDDLEGVPEDLRASVLVLRSAGVLPEELLLRKELLRLSDLIAACEDAHEARRLRLEREGVSLRVRLLIEQRAPSRAWLDYR